MPKKRDFFSKIQPEPNSGCWLWIGAYNNYGYGCVCWSTNGRYRKYFAHRLSYEDAYGPIPVGMVVDHKCRVRGCVNPLHLEVVTIGENVRRGEAGINQRAKTHCTNGHPYKEDNLYTYMGKQGLQRHCKTCRLERSRYYRALKK